MPQNPAAEALHPTQENIRFLIAYSNIYVDTVTGEMEIGARTYRTPQAAEERRRTHPVRSSLAFVGCMPVSTVVPEAIRLRAIEENAAEVARRAAEAAANPPAGEDHTESGETNDGEQPHDPDQG